MGDSPSDSLSWSPDATELLTFHLAATDPPAASTVHSTIQSVDPEFRQPPKTLMTIDGIIPCAPSWQRLDP